MSAELDMSAMENCVCFNLRWVTRKVTQFFDAEMRAAWNPSHAGNDLGGIECPGQLEHGGIKRLAGDGSHDARANLQPLQRDGLVELGGGGRGKLVELAITAKGRNQLGKLKPAWRAAQSAVVKTLGEKRWSAVLSDLETAALAVNK